MDKDLNYYDKLWQDSKPKDGMKHNKETWDRLAAGWKQPTRQSDNEKDKKIKPIVEFLLNKGVLNESTAVLDLGCGPGDYSIEFAKHAKSVTCSDVSPIMLSYCENAVKELEIENITIKEADFLTQSVEDLGWEKKYDLVFTSLTPAMDGLESVEKIAKVSRGWAFNNSFVYLKDSLKDEVSANVFGREPTKKWGSSSPYCLWNILWLKGNYPEIHYYTEEINHEYTLSEKTAQFVAENIIRDRAPNDEEVKKVFEYLKVAYPDGKVIRKTNALYAWILWEV